MAKALSEHQRKYLPDMDGGDKRRATSKVNRMVALGEIPSPNEIKCIFCNNKKEASGNVYHHYKSYRPENYEDVVVLCTICHSRLHKRANIGTDKEVQNKHVIWMDAEAASIVDEFRKTQTPIPTKKDALKRLVLSGWKVEKRKVKGVTS